ncbi:glycosyltransferase family 4 protein [Candidatus Fermentibacteria bacterium]|nr:glycosyltransferase family 4 protein [Candidatus Fermentibacteria bacterium]
MRFLIVTPLYWPDSSGATRLLQGYAEGLAAKGHTVEVWTTEAAENRALYFASAARVSVRQTMHGGVGIRRFRLWHPAHKAQSFGKAFRLPMPGSGYAFDEPHVTSLGLLRAAFLWRGRFDMVLAGYLPFTAFIYAGSLVAKRHGIPLAVLPLLHLGEPSDHTLLASFGRPLQRRVLHMADILLANTDVEVAALRQWGIEPRRVAVVGAGIDPSTLQDGVAHRFRRQYGLRHPIVFQVSTQTHDKGSHHLVEAMKQVWATGTEAHLILVGRVLPDFDEYFSQQPREVLERVVCTGHLGEQAKADLLAAGDVMVMLSRAESFGISYLEAWWYGKPVVGSYAGSLPALIWDGVDGFLVPFADVHMLAETLVRLLTRPDLRVHMGEAGRSKARSSFLWPQRLDRLERALYTVDGRKR